jgi:hypothetical protein
MSNKIAISLARPIITQKELEAHFSADKNLRWVKLKDLESEVPEQCVDGRCEQGIIGTPGGNMGEFILMLEAAEKITGKILDTKTVQVVFNQYLRRFGAFYLHTDTHALEHLSNHLDHSIVISETTLTTPPQSLRPTLLKFLLKPESIGCGHLKLMLLHPDEYQVRSRLIISALKAYYLALWSGHKLTYVVLDHDHHESAVVAVTVPDTVLTPQTQIPTVAPMHDNRQVFVYHPQAIEYLRRQIAQEIIIQKLIPGLSAKQHDAYLQLVSTRGAHLTRLTLSYLAMGLPHYTVTLSP